MPPQLGPARYLPTQPELPASLARDLADDFENSPDLSSGTDWTTRLRARYGVDLTSTYAHHPVRNLVGKGSGQLTLNPSQLRESHASGLGFAVLKTLIAQDSSGQQSMSAWAIPEAKMVVEPIQGTSGARGWTVTWKGRGWSGSFDDYLRLVETTVGELSPNLLVVPSVKYHLPAPGESTWRVDEYRETTTRLVDTYRTAGGPMPMPLEIDFSPTLAGSGRAADLDSALDWVRTSPRLVREAAGADVAIALKLFNWPGPDADQLTLLIAAAEVPEIDSLVVANRLFDPTREFEGVRGVAYGGPDLSDRNLSILSAWRSSRPTAVKPISATGDISSGRIAAEYLLRGASTLQLHTFFQLPATEYAATTGSKVARAMHQLLLHPTQGLVAWMLHAAARLEIQPTVTALAESAQSHLPVELQAKLG